MTEDTTDQHGDETVNATGMCASNPFLRALVTQQQVAQCVLQLQLQCWQAAHALAMRTVFK